MDEHANNINRLFEVIELQGVDTNTALLYGYFFVDTNTEKLETLKTKLADDGYTLVNLGKAEDGSFLLHVEKVESHSRESLLKRLQDFEQLATEYEITSFDGWDLGNPDKNKPLITNEGFERQLQGKAPQALFDYAEKLLDYGVFSKAAFVFDQCIENHFEVEQSLYKQFICYDCLEMPQKAIANLEKILEINPSNFKACFNMGAISYDQKDYAKSIEYYQRVSEIEKNNEYVYYGLALSQFAIGDMQKSEENCKAALKLNPNNAKAKALLTVIENKNA